MAARSPYCYSVGASPPRVVASPPPKTEIRREVTRFIPDPAPDFDAESRASQRPVVSVDVTERLFVPERDGGVPFAMLENSLLAPLKRPMGDNAARPVAGVLCFDVPTDVTIAKAPTQLSRSQRPRAGRADVSAKEVLDALVSRDIVLSQLPQALRTRNGADPAFASAILAQIVTRIYRTVTERPGALHPDFVLVVSGHGGCVRGSVSNDVPLVCVANGAPPSPALREAWDLVPANGLETLWNARALRHTVGEADHQHFHFLPRLARAFAADSCWINSRDADAMFNGIFYITLRAALGLARELPRLYIRVPVVGRSPTRTECVSAAADALAAHFAHNHSRCLSYLSAIALSGNDFIPTLARPAKNGSGRNFRVTPAELGRSFETFTNNHPGYNELFEVARASSTEKPAPYATIAETSRGCVLRLLLLPPPRLSSPPADAMALTLSATRIDFDIQNVRDFLRGHIQADYVARRFAILLSFIAHTAQLGTSAFHELLDPDTGSRLGFIRDPTHGHFCWDFRGG